MTYSCRLMFICTALYLPYVWSSKNVILNGITQSHRFFVQSLNYSYILITFHRSVLQYFIRWQKATFHLDLISIWFLILILKIICFLWLLIHHNSNLILVVGFCAFYRLHYCLFLYSIYICATYNTLSKVVVNLKCSINTVE